MVKRETETEFQDGHGVKRVAVTCPECKGEGCEQCDGKGFSYRGSAPGKTAPAPSEKPTRRKRR